MCEHHQKIAGKRSPAHSYNRYGNLENQIVGWERPTFKLQIGNRW